MKGGRRVWHRIVGTLFGRRLDDDFAQELESHLQMQTDEYVRSGLSAEQARRAAAVKVGSAAVAQENWRDQRGLPSLEAVPRDIRLALRGLRREPLISAVCILTMSLAVGANSAIFSVVNAVLIRPLPYLDADRLVQVWETNPRANRWGDWASYPDFLDWQRDNETFDGVGAFRYRPLRLTGGEYPEMLVGLRVSPKLLSVLGLTPATGRPFLPEEGDVGRDDVAMVSYELWQRRFGGDPALVGQSIAVDDRRVLVVGILPAGLTFPANLQGGGRVPDVWIPAGQDLDRGSHNYRVVARLKPGRTVEQAQVDIQRLVQDVAELDPGHRGRGGAASGLKAHTAAVVRPALLILTGATLLVLLIACANIANLLLARGTARLKETSLQLALGASPGRVLQQGLTQSGVLALLGGTAGLLVAFAAIRFLTEFGPALPLIREATIDPRVLMFTLFTSLISGIAFGVAPVVKALKTPANDVLKDASPKQIGSEGRARIRRVLTVVQVALALVLLIGTGLLMRSFVRVRGVDAGFDARNLLAGFLAAPAAAAEEPNQTVAFFQDVISRLERIPGVKAVAAASAVPLLSNESSPYRVEGQDPAASEATVFAEQPRVTPGYFRTMRIAMASGRDFTIRDTASSAPVAVVSASLAKTHWPGQNAVGRRVSGGDKTWRTVVGVVEDVRHDGLESAVRPAIYIPFAQAARPMLTLVLRTESNPQAFIAPARQAVLDVERREPLFAIQAMDETLGASLSLRRFLLTLIAAFAVMAAVLGVVGVYGVLAYFVTQRRQEIGIRLALGVDRATVVWMVVRQAAVLGGAGVAMGVIVALAMSRALAGMLFGISATDPLTFSLVPLGLLLAVIVAAFIPARVAASIQPMLALRGE